MKRGWAVLLVVLAVKGAYGRQGSVQDAAAVIQGTVTRSGSGEPLPDVHVTMQGGVSTVTDRQGHFTITDVQPGRGYTLQAEKDGFYSDGPGSGAGRVVPSFGAASQIKSEPEWRQVTIDSAKEYTIKFELVPGGSVNGRIQGPDNKPIPYLNVTAFRLEDQKGKRTLQIRGSAQTDDLGEFRIFWLKPGRYFLSAEYHPPNPSAFDLRNTLAKTFYPGVLDENNGASIEVLPAGEAPADFFMVSTAKIKVSGRVISTTSGVSAGSFYLIPRNSRVSGDNVQPFRNLAADRSDGKFELRDVTPGSYYLFPVVLSNGTPLSGRTLVDTGYSDLEGVTVVLHPNVDLKGRIDIDPSGQLDDALRKRLGRLPLRLRAVDPIPALKATLLQAKVADDGSLTFVFSGLPEGTYQLESAGLGGRFGGIRNAYLAGFRQGPLSVIDDGIVTVGADDAEPLLLTIGLNGGTIQGTVTTADLKPATMAAVTVIPQGARRQNPFFYKNATTDSNGRFVVYGLGPGEYRIFAWENLPDGADQNPDFMAQFDRDGQTVTVTPGFATSISLKAIPDQTQR